MVLILYTDQPVLVAGLAHALASCGELAVHSVCSTFADLMETMGTQQPDIVLMDLTSEVTFGSLSQIKRTAANSKIVLWVHSISTELAFQAMGLGVRGILRKTLPIEMLVKCLEKVQEGELWFEKALTDDFLMHKRIALTQREGQLVRLLSQGLKNKEIATALEISEGTVKVYLSRLFQKVGVEDRFELALYGLRNLTAGPGEPDETHATGARPLPGLRSIVLPPHHIVPPREESFYSLFGRKKAV